MKAAAVISSVFLTGQHGFAVFAPYLGVYLVALLGLRAWQRRALVPV